MEPVDLPTVTSTSTRTVESLIPHILADFRAVAARMHEVDEERKREQLAREAAERQRQELAARRAANQELIHELESQAGAWHRARFLRRYLLAARRAVGPNATWTVDLQGQSTDFFAWAEHYVNQLDPLHPEPRDEDLHHQPEPYYAADEKRWNEELQRCLGHTWERALKLADAGPPASVSH